VGRSLGPRWLRRLRYRCWIVLRERRAAQLRELVSGLPQMQEQPLISILLPVHDPPVKFLAEAIASVSGQLYDNWELCIADDASSSASVRQLLQRSAAAEPRIRLSLRADRGHISAATNTALGLAHGEWVVFLDHDDLLAPHALARLAQYTKRTPGLRFVYSDEDKCDEGGRRYEPHFKPDWNPALLYSLNYLGHLCAYRLEDVRRNGGMREGYEGAQDYDLALRVTRHLEPAQIAHIPEVLYHWRAILGSTARDATAKDYATEAGIRALQDRLRDTPGAEVSQAHFPTSYRVRWRIPGAAPQVSIIIPTRDRAELLARCLRGVLLDTDYAPLEVLIVDNDSRDRAALDVLDRAQQDPRVRRLNWSGSFNYSAINNMAASQAQGEVLCFLNNDVEVLHAGWLTEMVEQAQREGIGAVGAKLYYPDGTVQHAGVVVGLRGVADHPHKGFSGADSGYFMRLKVVQEYSAVTAACMVIRRDAFEAVGGFDAEHLEVIFNDVELCLRLREAGLRNVWTPYAELRHHESATRRKLMCGNPVLKRNADWMRRHRSAALARDPYWNPALSLRHYDFRPTAMWSQDAPRATDAPARRPVQSSDLDSKPRISTHRTDHD
jgi:O-antigen biosynthesis protein